MLPRSVLTAALGVVVACAAPARAPEDGRVVITNEDQREAAVDREVTIIGVQTRTKVPSVCGVDVDGAYELSDRVVVVRGVLRRFEIAPPKPGDPIVATRAPGTYYAVVDPGTGELAKTTLRQ